MLTSEDFHRFTAALAVAAPRLVPGSYMVREGLNHQLALMDLQVWLCGIHASTQLPAEPVKYDAADPTTWTRSQLVAFAKGAQSRQGRTQDGHEVRRNEDGTVDEVVAQGASVVHLEQMDDDHWWLGVDVGGAELRIDLRSEAAISCHVEVECD